MYLVACGAIGLGDLIWETESGRPLGMSRATSRRDSRRLEDEECFSRDEECLDDEVLDEECFEDELLLDEDLWEDLSDGTSRMFKTRPVVGSVVDD
jgi:hypothetical protein